MLINAFHSLLAVSLVRLDESKFDNSIENHLKEKDNTHSFCLLVRCLFRDFSGSLLYTFWSERVKAGLEP